MWKASTNTETFMQKMKRGFTMKTSLQLENEAYAKRQAAEAAERVLSATLPRMLESSIAEYQWKIDAINYCNEAVSHILGEAYDALASKASCSIKDYGKWLGLIMQWQTGQNEGELTGIEVKMGKDNWFTVICATKHPSEKEWTNVAQSTSAPMEYHDVCNYKPPMWFAGVMQMLTQQYKGY